MVSKSTTTSTDSSPLTTINKYPLIKAPYAPETLVVSRECMLEGPAIGVCSAAVAHGGAGADTLLGKLQQP